MNVGNGGGVGNSFRSENVKKHVTLNCNFLEKKPIPWGRYGLFLKTTQNKKCSWADIPDVYSDSIDLPTLFINQV